MLLSQILTLTYGALLSVGGVIGYVKSKSKVSLAAGIISGSILFYVNTQLPEKPVYAASIGLGVSAVLLVAMGIRYKNSRKLFPAGIVSLLSLFMAVGYLHGILHRTYA